MTTEQRVKVRALTYNIQGFVSQFWTGWAKERKMGRLMREASVDVCVMQEAWDGLTSRVIKRAGGFEWGCHTKRPRWGDKNIEKRGIDANDEACVCRIGCGLCGRPLSVYGNGLATLVRNVNTTWQIIDKGRETWRNKNKRQWEGGIGAWKGFSWVRLRHVTHEFELVVYNLHGMAADLNDYKTEFKAWGNYLQLGKHIMANARDAAVLVGGDFNWRHRWRSAESRPEECGVDGKYNALFSGIGPRYDVFDSFRKSAGGKLWDVEWVQNGKYDWSAPVDRFWVRNGKGVHFENVKTTYLYKDTPWHGLSDHHPVMLDFDLVYTTIPAPTI